MMRISFCSATEFEVIPLRFLLEQQTGQLPVPHQFDFLTTGIGMLQSGYAIQQHLQQGGLTPDLLVQVGIAGCFDHAVPLESVFIVGQEHLGSCGVQESGQWRDLFDLGLAKPDQPPFTDGTLANPWVTQFNKTGLPVVAAVTVDEVTTDKGRIQALRQHYAPSLESMEGAALHFNGLLSRRPFLQIRAVSNYIGDRDKSRWHLKAAIEASCHAAFEWLLAIGGS